jgi:hypothetical protein
MAATLPDDIVPGMATVDVLKLLSGRGGTFHVILQSKHGSSFGTKHTNGKGWPVCHGGCDAGVCVRGIFCGRRQGDQMPRAFQTRGEGRWLVPAVSREWL